MCPLYRYETTGQLLHSEVGSNQVGCGHTWQRSLSCETNTGASKEVSAPNQSWRGCNHPTSNWPYRGHQIPYLVLRTAELHLCRSKAMTIFINAVHLAWYKVSWYLKNQHTCNATLNVFRNTFMAKMAQHFLEYHSYTVIEPGNLV